MLNWLTSCFIYLQLKFNQMRNKMKEEKGDATIIAIILVIVVVIALAIIFRDQLTNIVNRLFGKINEDIDSF